MLTLTLKSLVVCGVLMLGAAATAQQVAPTPPLPPTTPYGPPVILLVRYAVTTSAGLQWISTKTLIKKLSA